MPIYEYRCAECHQVFEEWCKQVDDGHASRPCPICKGASKRLISNTSFALKGGGWYATEYGAAFHVQLRVRPVRAWFIGKKPPCLGGYLRGEALGIRGAASASGVFCQNGS